MQHGTCGRACVIWPSPPATICPPAPRMAWFYHAC